MRKALLALTCLLMVEMTLGQDQAKLQPFLTIPLAKATHFNQSEGWHYSVEEKAIHGFSIHFAHDFSASRNTAVYAPCEGWAIASSHFFPLDRQYQGKTVGFGLGNFVQIWNPTNRMYVMCAHLEKVAEGIPYTKPTPRGAGWYPTVLNSWHALLLQNATTAQQQAKWVRRGDLIGYVGDSGCSWGYTEAPGQARDHKQPSWDETHVHMEVFRRDAQGNKAERIDPYGKEGAFPEQALWLLKPDGQPKCADEK